MKEVFYQVNARELAETMSYAAKNCTSLFMELTLSRLLLKINEVF